MDFVNLIIKSNTLNFIIVAAVIVFLVIKMNVIQKLENTRDDIKNYVNASEEEKRNAELSLDNIKEKINKLPEEIEKINKSAKNSVQSLEKKMDETVKEQMLDIDNNSKRIMNLETKKFKSNLTMRLSEVSVNLAMENAVNQLKNNRELHDKYISEAIEQIDKAVL